MKSGERCRSRGKVPGDAFSARGTGAELFGGEAISYDEVTREGLGGVGYRCWHNCEGW